MADDIPEDGPAFEALMREIDAKLTREGIAIAARPLLAGREISLKYGVDFPMFDPGPRGPPELRRYGPIATKVHAWFAAAYADRLNIDLSPGRMVIDLDNDFYMLRFPRFWGRGEIVISRLFFPKENLQPNKAFRLNIIELLDGMTEPKAKLVSSDAMRSLFGWFPIGLRVFYDLETNAGIELLRIARGDLDTAADKLMDRGDRYGESKWASLQAVEKCFKAVIALENANYKWQHGLDALANQVEDCGIELGSRALLADIQTKGGIRYGELACTRADALTAHHAAICVIHDLLRRVRQFDTNLTINKLGTGTYVVVKSIPPRQDP